MASDSLPLLDGFGLPSAVADGMMDRGGVTSEERLGCDPKTVMRGQA